MKRVLSLVLALVMVFGTIMPVFAEETVAAKTSGEMLQAYGLIKGTDKGLEEDQPLNRAGMATILARLNNKEDVAATYAFPASFTDVPADAWYAKTVAYAEAQAWMIGDAKGGTFRPLDNLSAQEVNMLMVRALGYSDVKWEDANAKAEELNIAVVTADKTLVLRGEIFTAMTATLDVPKKDETDTLGTSLALVGYTSPTPAIPEKLEVATVMTDNLKTIIVEFNQELNKKTVVKGNFTVSGYTVEAVKLAEDNKTVTLTISGSGIAQSKEVKLTIEKIKDVTDVKTIETYKDQAFIVNDVTIPVIESLSVVDAKSVKIKASEPMNWSEENFTSLAGIKLDGNSFYGKVTPNYVTHEYTIEFNTVKKEGSYKLTVEGVKDYAGLAAVKKEFSFDIAKDDKAPVALSAKAVSVKAVEVTFDEPVQTLGTITINGKETTLASKADDKKIVVATFKETADKLDLAATVEVNVKYKGQKDVVGNEVKTETTLTFKVADDTTLPSAVVEIAKANKVTITFSKAMDTDLGTIRVLDKDKKEKLSKNVSDFAAKWNADKTVLTLLATDLGLDNMNPADRIIELKNMKDSTIRANLLAMVETSIMTLDTKAPEVTSKFTSKNNADDNKKDEITFFFTEAMDEDTMKNLSNYRIDKAGHADNGKTFAQLSTVSVKAVSSDKKSITFYYEGIFGTEATYMVYAVKDTAGNMMTTPTAVLTLGNGDAFTVVSATVTGTKTVKVLFNSEVKTADPSFLKLIDDSTPTKIISANSMSISGSTVTFTLETALPTDTDTWKLAEGNYKGVTNVYGITVVDNHLSDTFAAAKVLVDKVAPTVASMEEGQYTAGAVVPATKNYAAIKMSEMLSTDALTPADYIVKLNGKVLSATTTPAEYTIAVVNDADDNYISVHVLNNSQVSTNGKYSLEVQLIRNSNLTDMSAAKNVVAPFTKSITDFNFEVDTALIATQAAETAVLAYEALAVTDDAAITATLAAQVATKLTATTAISAAPAASQAAFTLRVTNKDAAITAAATVATVEVANVNIAKESTSTVAVAAVAKNAAGVVLTTNVTYAWSVTAVTATTPTITEVIGNLTFSDVAIAAPTATLGALVDVSEVFTISCDATGPVGVAATVTASVTAI